MSTIHYENIFIDGIPFSKLHTLEISHKVNDHGRADITGFIKTEDADFFVERADDTFLVTIRSTAENQIEDLFVGIVSSLDLKKENDYSKLSVSLVSISSRIDIKRNNASFQQTTMSYGQVMKTVIGEQGFIKVLAVDKPIGGFVMQYNETDWEFIVRMAAGLGSVVVTSLLSKEVNLYIGVPQTTSAKQMETVSYSISRSETAYQQVSNNTENNIMREDFSSEKVLSYDYAFVGDIVLVNGMNRRVKEMTARLFDGILECSYVLGLETSFVPPKVINKQATGRMLTGVVTAVDADKVQVHLPTIDSSVDGASDWWFPYSTAYSSQSGSGWYAMPEVSDEVRVFFPSDNEADAFAASSVTKNIRPNVKEKSFNGVNGKQILLTEEGMVLICKNGKMYIKMSEENGIEITSDMDINITSSTKVNIQAGDSVQMAAKNEIILGTPGAYIDIRPEEIIMTAENILLK